MILEVCVWCCFCWVKVEGPQHADIVLKNTRATARRNSGNKQVKRNRQQNKKTIFLTINDDDKERRRYKEI
jgi:hypothetical protein